LYSSCEKTVAPLTDSALWRKAGLGFSNFPKQTKCLELASKHFSSSVEKIQLKGSKFNHRENDNEYMDSGDIVSPELIAVLLSNQKKGFRPGVVRERLSKLRVYQGKQNKIKGSPWKLNLVCQFAAGQTVLDALRQLQFNNKAKAPVVAKVIQKTANLAHIRDRLLPSQLEVAECFSTNGSPLKGIRYHAKGRFGKMLRRFSHLNVKLREIDFDLKIAQCKTEGQMRRWLEKKALAIHEVESVKKEMAETDELEEKYAALERQKKLEQAIASKNK